MTFLHPVYKFQPSFGRRKSHKISGKRAELMEKLLPLITISPPENPSYINLQSYFEGVDDYWLEIGFGAGEHLAYQAASNPNVGIIGCEPFIDGVAKLLLSLDENDMSPHNIRLFADDARLLLTALPDQSLSRIFILFPDPWRKPRHYKRRVINPETLEMIARILKPNGMLRIATDHQNYAEWVLEHLLHDNRFTWTATTPDEWHNEPKDWVLTRYQEKAIEEQRKPYYFDFIKTK